VTEVSNTRADELRTGGSVEPDRAEEGGSITLEFMIRSSSPVAGTPTEALDALSHLRARDRIDGFEVIRWPEKVVLGEGRTDVVERFESFERWAEECGLSVRPAFERRTVRPLLGGRRTELRTPVMCLAVYADDELGGVYPCSDGERTWSAHGFLERCREHGEVPLVRTRGESPAPGE